ncbi:MULTISPECIES: DUF2914 domain-containing protein [Pseudoalteromonas]|uniref:DUF2914 domain-containing protein n=1 Tax=Pseudoalteromonas TaxID=53246 RepID=UPI001582DEB2|nr:MULTISPECIES: DUF2914 domain-containing protein [Pseudoalteromonas]MDI4652990.1 DUF2914 domain-containing protein [Pseudoalteromonas shioyasakiensis]NUJ39073.1 DUF2914 domain-containing protein [Pseudoalteromonas sp. 0303]
MTKKLVITANMNAVESAGSTPTAVTYQWHWRRIFMVSSVILVALAILVYSFIGAVNAEQSPQDEPQAEFTNAELQAPSNDAEQEEPKEVDASSMNEQTPEADNTETAEAEVVSSNIVEPDVTTVENEIDSEQVVDEQQPETPAVTLDGEEVPQTEQQVEIAADPDAQQQFSQSAHIASVAIGAKIDTDKVSRAVLTTDVVDREPVNVLKNDVKLAQISNSLSFFSELRNLQGQTVRHQWYYQGQQLASIELAVSSPRFRTYSTKNIMPEQLGDWRVEVIDADGNLLAQKEFRILAE